MPRLLTGRQRGIAMIEFALMAPVTMLLIFGMIDFSRIVQAKTTVGEAARQGARQGAANAATTDLPFGATDTNPCSGVALSANATGHGCLTDARILETVTAVMSAGNLDRSPRLNPNGARDAASCSAAANLPPVGSSNVCITPPETGTAGSYTNCTTAKSSLGHDPAAGDLGDRSDEFSSQKYSAGRCFLVEVTVVYTYAPFTGFLQQVIGNSIHVASSTSTVAEY